MRKLSIAIAVGALAVCLAVAPAAAKPGPKAPKDVASTVTLVATPTTIDAATTTVAVSGNVKANSSCRKNRTVRFSYTDAGVTTDVGTAVTGPNGDYSVALPKPTTAGPLVTLTATVDAATRKTKGQSKGKGKKKGHGKKARKFNCLSGTASSVLTVPAAPTI